ncbi:hypothetical protein CJ030_MR5G025007 [Morella rubra]|uniref:Uncharacterized protein n=1 Tax=Morella rubra TaxID=262757 RepID=A0A6A1VHA4_9ROSI|nr:hypothetical protein CJ030_MR5G025007 [Morella rubra]
MITHIMPPSASVKVQNVEKHTLSQSKSHKGHFKSLPSSDPSRGPLQSDIAHLVEATKLLTERSTSSAFAQSTLLANQEVFELDLTKAVADVALIQKNLKLDEASSSANPPKEGKEDVEEDEGEEEEDIEEGDDEEEGEADANDDAVEEGDASATSDDE